MDEIEKAERINKIETNLIARIKTENSVKELLSAIAILTKRPGERIDEALLYATKSRHSEVCKAAFEALKKRISYIDSK